MAEPVTFYVDPKSSSLPGIRQLGVTAVEELEENSCSRLLSDIDAGRVTAALFDGYRFGSKDVIRARSGAFTAAIRDDMDTYPVDAILRHGFLSAQTSQEIGGPHFALLSRKWQRRPASATPFRNPLDSGLSAIISFGAVDSGNLTSVAAQAVLSVPDARAGILLPRSAPHFGAVSSLVVKQERIRFVDGDGSAYASYASSDVAIGAPGVAMLERAACGLPTLLIIQNELQVPNALAAVRQGVAEIVGDARQVDFRQVANALLNFTSDSTRLSEMRSACLRAVDGRGAERAAAWLLGRRRNKGHG